MTWGSLILALECNQKARQKAQQEADRNNEENPNPRDMIPGFLGWWRFSISERPGRFFVNSGSNG